MIEMWPETEMGNIINLIENIMMENICSQGHVIDFGKDICSRCNGRAIGMTENPPVIANEAPVVDTPVVKKARKPRTKKVDMPKKKKGLLAKVFGK